MRVLVPRLVTDPPPGRARRAVRSDVLPTRQEAILLVEDESRVRALAAQVLRAQGYHVVEAADGDEAVRAASGRGRTGELHLLVTDMLMPRMRGSEVAARIRLDHPDIKVLFISGHADLPGLAPRVDETTVPFLCQAVHAQPRSSAAFAKCSTPLASTLIRQVPRDLSRSFDTLHVLEQSGLEPGGVLRFALPDDEDVPAEVAERVRACGDRGGRCLRASHARTRRWCEA